MFILRHLFAFLKHADLDIVGRAAIIRSRINERPIIEETSGVKLFQALGINWSTRLFPAIWWYDIWFGQRTGEELVKSKGWWIPRRTDTLYL